jgi:hypothetical protein
VVVGAHQQQLKLATISLPDPANNVDPRLHACFHAPPPLLGIAAAADLLHSPINAYINYPSTAPAHTTNNDHNGALYWRSNLQTWRLCYQGERAIGLKVRVACKPHTQPWQQ